MPLTPSATCSTEPMGVAGPRRESLQPGDHRKARRVFRFIEPEIGHDISVVRGAVFSRWVHGEGLEIARQRVQHVHDFAAVVEQPGADDDFVVLVGSGGPGGPRAPKPCQQRPASNHKNRQQCAQDNRRPLHGRTPCEGTQPPDGQRHLGFAIADSTTHEHTSRAVHRSHSCGAIPEIAAPLAPRAAAVRAATRAIPRGGASRVVAARSRPKPPRRAGPFAGRPALASNAAAAGFPAEALQAMLQPARTALPTTPHPCETTVSKTGQLLVR